MIPGEIFPVDGEIVLNEACVEASVESIEGCA